MPGVLGCLWVHMHEPNPALKHASVHVYCGLGGCLALAGLAGVRWGRRNAQEGRWHAGRAGNDAGRPISRSYFIRCANISPPPPQGVDIGTGRRVLAVMHVLHASLVEDGVDCCRGSS